MPIFRMLQQNIQMDIYQCIQMRKLNEIYLTIQTETRQLNAMKIVQSIWHRISSCELFFFL